jgi:hypothetical protein
MSPDERPRAPGATRDATATSSSPGAPAPPRRRRGAPGSDGATAVEQAAPEAPAPPATRPKSRPSAVEPLQAPPAEPSPRRSPRRERRPVPPPEPMPRSSAPTEAVFEEDDEEELLSPRDRRRAQRAARATGPRGERRYRQTLEKVDLWSVTKLALCFYVSAMFVTIVALIALWLIADAAGVIKSVEDFFGDLLSARNFKFLSGEVLRGTILVALVVVALQVVITVIAASFYNIFSELFGGLEIVVKEEEPRE